MFDIVVVFKCINFKKKNYISLKSKFLLQFEMELSS